MEMEGMVITVTYRLQCTDIFIVFRRTFKDADILLNKYFYDRSSRKNFYFIDILPMHRPLHTKGVFYGS